MRNHGGFCACRKKATGNLTHLSNIEPMNEFDNSHIIIKSQYWPPNTLKVGASSWKSVGMGIEERCHIIRCAANTAFAGSNWLCCCVHSMSHSIEKPGVNQKSPNATVRGEHR
jgi:hypothetical protein